MQVNPDEGVQFGEKVASGVVGGMGSWRFIIGQTIIVSLWIAANVYLLTKPFDPFPFILLNLAFSTQAAYSSPLILMAANLATKIADRNEARQRARDEEKLDRLERLEMLLSSHVDDIGKLTREVHAALPATGCVKHAPQALCVECMREAGVRFIGDESA